MKFSISKKNYKKNLNRGFSLMELIMVITISGIMLTVVVIKQSTWNDTLAVNTQVYDLASIIRQAQTYSLGVRENSYSPSGDNFNVGYGIYLSQDSLNSYIFFVDKNNNKKYDGVGEKIEEKPLERNVTIKTVCGRDNCFPGIGPLYKVNIVFYRPESKASMEFLNSGGQGGKDNPPVTITLQSQNGDEASVKIEENGQVSIIQ